MVIINIKCCIIFLVFTVFTLVCYSILGLVEKQHKKLNTEKEVVKQHKKLDLEKKIVEEAAKEKKLDEEIESLYYRLNNPDFTDEEAVAFSRLCLEKQMLDDKKTAEFLKKCGFTLDEIIRL